MGYPPQDDYDRFRKNLWRQFWSVVLLLAISLAISAALYALVKRTQGRFPPEPAPKATNQNDAPRSRRCERPPTTGSI
jgi:hypothetical protein